MGGMAVACRFAFQIPSIATTMRIPCRPWGSTAFITTRHAASLRSSRNGRIGFKPPYSRGKRARKGSICGRGRE